jgi:hypothetical protein
MKSALSRIGPFVLIVTAVVLPAGDAFGIVVSGSGSPPTTNIEQSQAVIEDTGSGVFRWTADANEAHQISGQTWIHGSAFTLDKITVLFNPLGNAAALNGMGVSIRIYTYPTSSANGLPSTGNPGTPFLNEAGTFPTDLINNTATYLTFDVTNTALLANQQYGFLIDYTDGPNASYEARLVNNTALASYPNGNQLNFNYFDTNVGGTSDYDPVNDDLVFYIQSTSTALPGDFNGDGDVDGEDFAIWQSNFPKATGALPGEGDGDGDGDVDGADFVVWQTNFPFMPAAGASLVPEPSGLAIAVGMSLLGVLLLARKK